MLELWVVRHGETAWNQEERIQGWKDIPLTDTGRDQARILARYIQGQSFQAIHSSDLIRAYETAEILNEILTLPIAKDERLRERSFGDAEGLLRKESDKLYPNGSPNAESLETVQKRAKLFLDYIQKTYRKGRILCTTHGGMIRALLMSLGIKQIPSIKNTSVTRLLLDEAGQWQVLELTSIAHLQEAANGFDESVTESNTI